ncbi:MAG: permease prefix domain 1-containing protein [Oscillospiraceae bacterium]|nr:permease prefix domain 1-containing protein [Oscillospiraceae bacterium]
MEDKLRRYIEGIFEDTTPTRKAIELKEEMLQNVEDKYRDLLAEGKTPEAAFNIAVAGIGDVSVLLRQLEQGFRTEPEQEKYEQAQRKSAMLTAVAVMMYILSVLPVPLLHGLGLRNAHVISIPLFIVMVAAATGLLIYNSMTKPRRFPEADTIVEEFREWQAETQDGRQMRRAISSALWSLIVVLYFIISFTTMAWHITWIIFVAGGLVESLINIFYAMKNKGK